MKKPFLKAVSLFISVLFVFQNMAFAAEEILLVLQQNLWVSEPPGGAASPS